MMERSSADVAIRFRERFGTGPQLVARAPGRINLLGEHVDYHQGWVLPGAIDRGLEFAAAVRDDRQLRIAALDLDRETVLDLDTLPPPRREQSERSVSWHDLPAGVAWACRERRLPLRGLDVAFGGDLPIGAGVSSSAAVEVGLLSLWNEIGDWGLSRTTLARLGQRVENGYLGIGSGIMDQFASLHGRADHLLLLDCRTLDFEPVALPANTSVLVIDSEVRRRLAESGYNDRRLECERALENLRAAGFRLDTLRDLEVEQLSDAVSALDAVEARRVRHVVEECGRVRRAGAVLDAGRAAEVGRLMQVSHASLRDLYEVSIPELDLLAASANDHPDCHGARLTGAGFGGCVLALVDAGRAQKVASTVGDAFEHEYGRRPPTFETRMADGARVRLRD